MAIKQIINYSNHKRVCADYSNYKRVSFGDFVTLVGIACLMLTPLLVGVSFEMWIYQIYHFLAVLNNSSIFWFFIIVLGINNYMEMFKRIKAHKRRSKNE